MEDLPRGVEQRPSNIFGAGDDGSEDHDRPNLQRLHIQLRVRCVYEVGIALGGQSLSSS